MAVNKTKLKKQIFDIIQIGDKSNLASRAFDIFIVGVILSNISVMFLQTYDQLRTMFCSAAECYRVGDYRHILC